MADFDTKEYIQNRDAAEDAKRTGQQPAAAPATKVEAPAPTTTTAVAEPPAEKHDPPATNKERRTINTIRAELNQLKGELEAYKKLGIVPPGRREPEAVVPPDREDPEPQRKDFNSDAEYNRALGRWDSRQETKKTLDEADQVKTFKLEMETAREQFVTDRELYPDFDKVMEEFQDEHAKNFEMDLTQYPQLVRVLTTSPVSAGLMYHLFSNPDDLQKAISLEPKPGSKNPDYTRQMAFLGELSGEVKADLKQRRKSALDKGKEKVETSGNGKEPSTTAERDATKPRPSEAGAPRGGSAPATGKIPPVIEGKLNPVWEAHRNERRARR